MLPKVFLNIFYVANNERIDMEENSDIDILKTYLDMNRTAVIQRQTTVTAYFSCKQLLLEINNLQVWDNSDVPIWQPQLDTCQHGQVG